MDNLPAWGMFSLAVLGFLWAGINKYFNRGYSLKDLAEKIVAIDKEVSHEKRGNKILYSLISNHTGTADLHWNTISNELTALRNEFNEMRKMLMSFMSKQNSE